MRLGRPHQDWHFDLVSPINIRAIGLDQLLTQLWLRVTYENRPTKRDLAYRKIFDVVAQIEGRGAGEFQGFAENPGVAEAWLRADLLRVFKKAPDEFSVARPLHALATRVRNDRRDRDDSYASSTVYGWLHHAAPALLDDLAAFIDVDPQEPDLDLAAFGLALLGSGIDADIVTGEPRTPPTPLCFARAQQYAHELHALLAYREHMPRSVLTEHIARLTVFHLGLHYLSLFAIIADIESRGGDTRACDSCALKKEPAKDGCPYLPELVVDCGESATTPIAKAAEHSWEKQEDALARYVRAQFVLKKLHEVADRLKPTGKGLPHATLEEVAALERAAKSSRIDAVFDERIDSLKELMRQSDADELAETLERDYRALGLSPFRTYVAMLSHLSEKRWWNFHRGLLDSLFQKNTPNGLLRQPLGGRRKRRAALGAGLLETLALVAVVVERDGQAETRPLRIDLFLDRLRSRYGMLIESPPAGYESDMSLAEALADNGKRFRARLREAGLFVDLSDAYLAQNIRPRIHLRGEH